MVALALMVSCMPSAYTISASEAFGDGTEDIFTDGEITSEPAAEESTPDVSSADQEETEQAQQSTLTYENDSVKVTAEALEDGALPQNTALKADSVNENSSVSYDTVSQKLSAAATDKGSSLRGFFAYDVYFADGDGNRVEPNGRVRVTFEYKTPAAPELTDAASTSVTVEKLHYNSSTGDTDVNTLQANEDLKVLNVNEGKQIQTLQVETGNAAVFAVMWDSPETADVEAEAVSGNEDEVPIASEELTDGMDISDEPEQDAAETPAAENPEVTPDAEPSEAPAENPDAEPTEAPAEDPDVVEEPAEDIASPDEVPAADENGETSLIEVLGDDTNLRVSPSIEAEVLATVNAGTQLTLLDTVTAEDGATWYKVSWEGTEAYIRSDMAQVVDSSDEAEEVEDVLESEEVSYSQEVGNVVVTATAAKGVIPEGAQFVVTPIEKGSGQYADIEKQLHEDAENESYTVAGFLAYDISFLNDDGTKIEPQNGSVRVSIDYKEAEIPEDVAETDTAQENMNVSLVHFVEDANGNVTEVVNMSNDGQAEVSTTDNGEIESANFETESFSTFSVVWLADDFTSVQTTSSYGTESTVDSAASGITINMFNYDTPGINEGHSLKFSNGNGSDGANEDYNRYRGSTTLFPGIMQKTLGADLYPALNIRKWGENASSSYLFSKDKGNGKTVYSNANHLFKKDTDGYYEYDSATNFAQFNKKTKDFTVYEVPGSSRNAISLQGDSGNNAHGSFFPFNTLGDSIISNGIHEISGNSPDFHFGMTMSAKFIQPKDGKIKDNDMVFEFSGDDDVWVYIDGVLVLDIGGIHNAVSGSINFANGTVKVGNNDTNLKKLFNDANANIKRDFVSEKNIFKDYTAHTINFYYLERGEGDSNCKLKFNLPTVPKNSVTVEKQLSNTDKEKYANVEFKFQLLLQDDKREYVPSSPAGTLSDGGKVKFTKEKINGVSCDNVFTLKPGQKAIFSGLEENKNYKVRELGVSKDRYDRVLINGEETTNEKGNVISKEDTVGSRPVVVVTNVLASVAELDFKKVNTTGAGLGGARFVLTNDSTSETAISADDGTVSFKDLSVGTYTLKEVSAPKGYITNSGTWTVNVTSSDGKTATARLCEADSQKQVSEIVNYTVKEEAEKNLTSNKTVKVIDENARKFQIDLSAEVTGREAGTEAKGASVVLVMDSSGSMEGDRLAGIKSAAKEFVKTLKSASPISEVSVIWYSGDEGDDDTTSTNPELGSGFYQLNKKSDYDSLVGENGIIDNRSASGGTPMGDALEAANTKLTDTEAKYNNRYVIFFTDGLPGYYNSNQYGYGFYNCWVAKKAKAAAANIQKKAVLYTISYQLDNKQKLSWNPEDDGNSNGDRRHYRHTKISGSTFLAENIASKKDYAFNSDNIENLKTTFKNLAGKIGSLYSIQPEEIVDVIDSRFELTPESEAELSKNKNISVDKKSDGTTTITWKNEAAKIGNKDAEKAEDRGWKASFVIKAKDDFIGGNMVPTNGAKSGIYLTKDPESVKKFPQPSVNVKLLSLKLDSKEVTVFKGEKINSQNFRDELASTFNVVDLKGNPTLKAVLPKDGDIVKLPELSNEQIDSLNSGKEVTIGGNQDNQEYKYQYPDSKSNEPVGYFTYTYRPVNNPNVNQHTATTVGKEVESYELVVKYYPYSTDERKKRVSSSISEPEKTLHSNKTTDNKNLINKVPIGGTEVSGELSANGTYKVNVIAGQIQITKRLEKPAKKKAEFKFEIYKDGNVVQTVTATVEVGETEAKFTVDGKESTIITVAELASGNYTVKEKNQSGYKLEEAKNAEDVTNCKVATNSNDITFSIGTYTTQSGDAKAVDAEELKKLKTENVDAYATYKGPGCVGKVDYTNKEIVADVDFVKVDAADNNITINGAMFKLYKADESWTKGEEVEAVTSENGGTFGFEKLLPGNYLLNETKAATGYSLVTEPWKIVIKNNGEVTVTKNDGKTVIVKNSDERYMIENAKVYSLPESGGPGTYGFTISGVAILATALLLFINNKRREEEAKRS